ncbi:aspartate/glutamate racemase family protein [Halomonas sp. THAF12]|uniref:aspartate/glutamate racemase family protein n=1 Tax=Halomonas sp. B23F22_10 TaxID=3459515 RepID=UPI00373E147C
MNQSILPGGQRYYDTPLGVLCLESWFAKPRGHLRNPRSFDYPVVYEVLEGVDIPGLLHHPGDQLLELLIDRARFLERGGIKVIAGSCGFMARYQRQVAEAVSVPVVLSSLTLLSWLEVVHGPAASLGVLTADADALGEAHLRGAGRASGTDGLSIEGLQQAPEFREVILAGRRHDLDMELIAEEVAAATRRLMGRGPLDAIVLECTDLSAFADVVRDVSGLPVYDIVQAIDLVVAGQDRSSVHEACAR